MADPADAGVTVIVRSSGGRRRSRVRRAVSSLRVAGVGLVPCACGRASSLQVLCSTAGQGPWGIPTPRTRALRRGIRWHRLGSVGVSAVGSGMASICCRPSR